MNKYSDINIEYLDGFDCHLKGFMQNKFKIENGYYIEIGKDSNEKIDRIEIFIQGIIIYDKFGKHISVLSFDIDEDNKIIEHMLSYCKYNKRKQIIEDL